MPYTNEQKKTMYEEMQADLTNIVAKLEDFLENEKPVKPGEEFPPERNFATSMVSQLTGLIGNCAVRAKRCEDSA